MIALKVRLYLENDNEKFMGIGVLWLLREVEEKGSLLAACKSMGLSYSKALDMVSNLESALGHQVLVRQHGGSSRTGAKLTLFGQKFMNLYDDFQKECKTLLDVPFEKFSVRLSELAGDEDKENE